MSNKVFRLTERHPDGNAHKTLELSSDGYLTLELVTEDEDGASRTAVGIKLNVPEQQSLHRFAAQHWSYGA